MALEPSEVNEAGSEFFPDKAFVPAAMSPSRCQRAVVPHLLHSAWQPLFRAGRYREDGGAGAVSAITAADDEVVSVLVVEKPPRGGDCDN